MNTNSNGLFLYQPSSLEEAYGIYLLQTVFQINVHEGRFCNNARISGREAVPFLSKSGVDRQILRNVWTVADPQSVGSLISPQQFYTLLRLTALAQVGILGQALQQMNAFMSPAEVLQQCLCQTCQQQLPLAVFEGISIPNQESLFQLISKSATQMQQQRQQQQPTSDPFGSLSSPSSASWGSGFGTSLATHQPQAQQSSPSLQQQQLPNSHMNLTIGSASSFDGSTSATTTITTATAPTVASVPPQAPQSAPAPLQLSSIEDAFGGLVEVEDAPLPSLDQYVTASTPTAAAEVTKTTTTTEEPVHVGDDDDFGDFAGSSAEPAATAQTSAADPTATVGSAATTGTQESSLLSDVFGEMSQQQQQHQQQQPPIPASQSLVDPSSTVGSVATTVTQGSLLEDVFGAGDGSQQQQMHGSGTQTQQSPAQLVSEDENGDDEDDFGDFAGTTTTTTTAARDDSLTPVGAASEKTPQKTVDDSGPSGWGALDALADVQDAPLPALSSFGEQQVTKTEPTQQEQLESKSHQQQHQQQTEEAITHRDNVEDDEDETDFGDFEGTAEEVTPIPVTQTTGDEFTGSFGNPPMRSGDIKEDTASKGTESTSQEFGLFGEVTHDARSTESTSNGFTGSFEGSSMANVQVKKEAMPEVTKSASQDVGLFGKAAVTTSANSTTESVSQALSVDSLQGMPPSDSQGPALSGWDALDALGGIQDAPLRSFETLGSNDDPNEELTNDSVGNKLQTSSRDQLDEQNNTHQVDTFGSSTDQATPGITTAKSEDRDFGDFQSNESDSNKGTVFRPNIGSGDSASHSNEVVSDPADTSSATGIPRRQTAERIDSSYYSAQDSMSEEFEDALEAQPEQSGGGQQMPSEDVEASELEARENPIPANSSFGFPSSSPEAGDSDDPFSVFDSLAPPQPTIQPLSSFGQDDAEEEVAERPEKKTEKTLDQNPDEFGTFSATDVLSSEPAVQATVVAPNGSGDDFKVFSGFDEGAVVSHNDSVPDNKDNELLSGFSAHFEPKSGDLHATTNVNTEASAPKDDSFGDYGGFASAQDNTPSHVDSGPSKTSTGTKAVDIETFVGFNDFPGPQNSTSTQLHTENDNFGNFGDFSTIQGQVVGSDLQEETAEGGVDASIVQMTQQPQSSEKESSGGFAHQQMQEVDLGLEPRSQVESPEDESFGDFGDFSAAQGQIEEGMAAGNEGDALASSDVEAHAQPSPEDESFGDFGDFNAASPDRAPVDLFASSTTEAETRPQMPEDESFGDFGDFSAANDETTEVPDSIRSSTDVKQDLKDARFGDFASFDETKQEPSAPIEPDLETKNLIALRDFISSSSLQLPEGIRRQRSDVGGRHVSFNDVFDANIGMEVPVSDERKKRIQRSIQIMTVLSTSQTKLASTYWGQTFKISRDELSLACDLMGEVAEMVTEERDLVLKKMETYFLGMGEFVRVCRSIAATIGDLLMLDPLALLTVDTLNSSWCSLVLLEDYLVVEQLWKKFKNLAKNVGITHGQESEYRLESLTEIRAQAVQGSDRPVCCFTLQPLSIEPTLPTKTPLKWNDRPFMACAANLLANRIVSYATSTSFSEQDTK